jgi:hypothetical protein
LGLVSEFWDRYLPLFLRSFAKPNGLFSHDATVVVEPELSERNLDTIPDRTLQDVKERMPVFEPWCGHHGGSTPNHEAKAFSTPLIEASADYLTMITETLLQSHNGIIRVFPGWPLDRDAAFSGLVAEGGVAVSARLRDGVVGQVRLERRPGGVSEVTLKSPWSGQLLTIALPETGERMVTHDEE